MVEVKIFPISFAHVFRLTSYYLPLVGRNDTGRKRYDDTKKEGSVFDSFFLNGYPSGGLVFHLRI